MRRLLLMIAFAAAACFAHVGTAAAAVSDTDRYCEPGEEQLSLLSEASFAAVMQAAAQVPLDERCIARFGERADCQWNDDGAPRGPSGTWSPSSRDHWLPPAVTSPALRASRLAWLGEAPLVLSDGFERELERPPRG